MVNKSKYIKMKKKDLRKSNKEKCEKLRLFRETKRQISAESPGPSTLVASDVDRNIPAEQNTVESPLLRHVTCDRYDSSSRQTNEPSLSQRSCINIEELKLVSGDAEDTPKCDSILVAPSDISQAMKNKTVGEKCAMKRKMSDPVLYESENEEHELVIESPVDSGDGAFDIGHRIVDVNYFIRELTQLSQHASLYDCNLSTMRLVNEIKHGLNSVFLFSCAMCNKEFKIKNSQENLNKNAVIGAMVAGCGNVQLQNFTAALDLPQITQYLYDKSHDEVCQAWEETALDEMKKAGEEERQAAITEGRVTKNSIPVIDVIIDGCWCKRSYKTNYAALSGAAAIIGRRFGKVLFYAVRNKYCCICARAEKCGIPAREHTCYKNFTGPSTAMESDILVEGFKQSIEMHGVIYSRFISDGDSSTYAKILQARPYPDITVEKIGCRNHILRNFCNKLQHLKQDSRFDAKQKKMLTTERILSARKFICQAIKYHHENRQPDSVKKLHLDINASVQHAYSDHNNCNKSICSKESQQEPHEIFKCRIFTQVRFIAGNVASQARSLIENVDSNAVERFNGVIAKFVGGKRINYALKRSYQGRCAGAVVSFNTGKIYSTVHRKVYQQSPSKRLKVLEKNMENRRKYNKKNMRKKNRNLVQRKTDLNYGENVDSPDMDSITFELAKTTFLKNLENTDEMRREIQESTKLQGESGEWMELRRKLLTSSNFGKVIKRRKTNPCASIVKNMLYQPNISHVTSIKHGLVNEKIAREQLSEMLKAKIDLCGLFIDEHQPFLGASPDGIILEQNTLIEIKCPILPYKIGIDEAIQEGKMHFWKVDKKTGQTYVNKNSDWFMQVQGQMHICKALKCILAAWYGDQKMKIEVIEKDDKFWRERMEPNLCAFYFDCLLPELVDPRFTRGRPIREPSYVKSKEINKENVDSVDVEDRLNKKIEIKEPDDSQDAHEPEDTSNELTIDFVDF